MRLEVAVAELDCDGEGVWRADGYDCRSFILATRDCGGQLPVHSVDGAWGIDDSATLENRHGTRMSLQSEDILKTGGSHLQPVNPRRGLCRALLLLLLLGRTICGNV